MSDWTSEVGRDARSRAVERLMRHAEKTGAAATGASRVFASVLLAAYNGDRWACDPTDLAGYGADDQAAGMTILAAKILYGHDGEPHRVIEDGQARFARLVDAYTGSAYDRHRHL